MNGERPDPKISEINPATAFGLTLAKRMRWGRLAAYVPSQILGAIAGSLGVRVQLGERFGLDVTQPLGGVAHAFWVEAFLATLLFLVVIATVEAGVEKSRSVRWSSV